LPQFIDDEEEDIDDDDEEEDEDDELESYMFDEVPVLMGDLSS
jgi:hypothetical protein